MSGPVDVASHLAATRAALAGLRAAATDTGSVTADEVIGLRGLLDDVDRVCTMVFGRFVDAGGHLSAGFIPPATWLASHTHALRGEGVSRRAVASLVRDFPELAAAADDRVIGMAHLRTIAAAITAERLPLARRDMAVILDTASTLDASTFRKAMRVWESLCDDELGDPSTAEETAKRRRVRLHEMANGMWRLDGDLGPLVGEALAAALEAAMGRPAADDDRSPVQRRHDALGDIARASLAGQPDTTTASPAQVTLIIREDTGETTTSSGSVVSTADRDTELCGATVTPVWLDPTGRPFDVGTPTSAIPTRNRRAVIARDRHCRYPGCDRPPRWSDIHHVQHRRHGGTHHPDGLLLLCRRHHRMIHTNQIDVHVEADGCTAVFRSRDGTEQVTRPHQPDWQPLRGRERQHLHDLLTLALAKRHPTATVVPLAGI